MSAYIVADVEVTDAAAYEEYRKHVPDIITAYGGRYLVRGGACEILEGSWQPKRSVILEFATMAALKRFWESPEYRPFRVLRERAAKSHLVAIEGL